DGGMAGAFGHLLYNECRMFGRAPAHPAVLRGQPGRAIRCKSSRRRRHSGLSASIPFMFARVRTTALCVRPIREVQLMSVHDVPLRRARPFYPWVSEATPCVRYGLHAQASSGEGAVLKAGRIEPE